MFWDKKKSLHQTGEGEDHAPSANMVAEVGSTNKYEAKCQQQSEAKGYMVFKWVGGHKPKG